MSAQIHQGALFYAKRVLIGKESSFKNILCKTKKEASNEKIKSNNFIQYDYRLIPAEFLCDNYHN
jgi:hypothetical protein